MADVEFGGSPERFPEAARPYLGVHAPVVVAAGAGRGTTTFLATLAQWLAERGRRVGVLELHLSRPGLGPLLGLEGPPPHQGDVLLPRFVRGVAWLSPAFFSAGRPLTLGAAARQVVEVYHRDVLWGPLELLLVEAPEEELLFQQVERLFQPVEEILLGGYVARLPHSLFLQCPPCDRPGLPFDPGLPRGEMSAAYRAAVAEVAEYLAARLWPSP